MTYEDLQVENRRLQRRIQELEAELARLQAGKHQVFCGSLPIPCADVQKMTAGEKEKELQRRLDLFRNLFRGREDVYAQRFVNKSGKAGYQPACRNRWSVGCKEQSFRCHACPHRDLIPLDEQVIRRHLHKDASEKEVVGIYPILEDNTCYFLCADFDDKSCTQGYKKDALSYVRVCKDWNIPAYIERSRSGNGAHVWMFFSEPVSAAKARKLGFSVLSAVMEENVRVEMKSYDRFFPNQDFLPKGGFGNLVALPLQGLARKGGNSVFVDENFVPFSNQWDVLATVLKVSDAEVSAILSQHNVQLDISSSTEVTPWETPKPIRISFEDFQSPVKMIRANGLYISLSCVSGKAIRHLKGLATFRNPKYYELLNARKPVYHTPSLVSRFEISDEYLRLPRGCEDAVIELLQRNFSTWEIEDKSCLGKPIDAEFNGALRREQEEALRQMLAYDSGVLAATTAFGKTVTATGLMARRKVNTLVLVPSRSLLGQWKNEIERFLTIRTLASEDSTKTKRRKKTPSPVGVIDGTKNTRTGIIDIAVFNSALTKDGVKPFVREYGMVIADECHHTAAIGYERVLQYTTARYVYGLSATPTRQDGMTPIIFMQCGPIRYVSDAKVQMAGQSFSRILIPRFTPYRALEEKANALQHLSDLTRDKARNEMIVKDVADNLKEGRNPIVLTKRKEHIDILADMLRPLCENVICLTGTASAKEKRKAMDKLQKTPETEPLVIVATGNYVGEGFNCPRLDTLFIALPVAYPNIVQQYTGRLHREVKGKKEVRVYDYIDIHVPVLANMYGKRLKHYAPIGYSLQTEEILRTEPQNIVYGREDYLAAFIEDVDAAKSSVVIACDTLQYMKNQLAKAMQALNTRGAECRILVQKTSDRDHDFSFMGIRVVQESGPNIRAAIIDRSILWFGSIDLAGSRHREEDHVMRINAPAVASEILGYLLDEKE